MATMPAAIASPKLDTRCPLDFFTNVASRLLSAQFNLDTTRIQIYPTNQYTPAVHRLLQLAANIYEATSTNAYPTVFRPLFSRDAAGFGANLFISGFTNVASITGPGDGQLALPVEVAALAETNVQVVNLPVNVYGIPWIIGARKGLPNFNEFAMESIFQLTRKLQVTRQNTNDTYVNNPGDYHFNQMFTLSLTNQLAVECWNSCSNDFTDPVTIYVTDNQSVTLTNDEGLSTNIPVSLISGFLQIPNSSGSNWPGYNPTAYPLSTPASFQIPLNVNVSVMPTAMYRFNVGNTVPESGYVAGSPYLTTNLDSPYESGVTWNGQVDPQPHWWLTTSNDFRVIIIDTAASPYHIIDYVQLSGPDNVRDLTGEIMTNYDVPFNTTQASGNELWNTNVLIGMPIGILSQIGVSLGNYNAGFANGVWDTTDPIQLANEIAGFEVFMGYTPSPPLTYGEVQAIALAKTSLSNQAPYLPVATMVQIADWQVNDPLVHYLAEDIDQPGIEPSFSAPIPPVPMPALTNSAYATIGQLNTRYMPWGGHQPINPNNPDFNTLNAYNLALKDPLVWRSDDWDFPTNESLSNIGEWLGRVHRGTPWQTVYLKTPDILDQTNSSGTNIGTNTWMAWTGDTDAPDAVAMAPVQDWHLASLLAYLMNTNDFASLLSVNESNTNAWLNSFNGLTALTNILADNQVGSGAGPQFDALAISPGLPQASLIVNAIQSAKAGQPGGFFRAVGDILATPQLTVQSPFLNWSDIAQQEYGISDEAYEILPSQLLSLLRADSVGSAASMNGQFTARFTGYDNHVYAVEVSSNLVDWTGISTNLPVNGGFSCTNSTPANPQPQFYRSRLIQ
jgi:hypothetical protein